MATVDNDSVGGHGRDADTGGKVVEMTCTGSGAVRTDLKLEKIIA